MDQDARNSTIEVFTFPVAPLSCNCSILHCKESGEAIVIDPGGEAEKITRLLSEKGCRVRHIVHTHAHFDHILGTDGVAAYCRSGYSDPSGAKGKKPAASETVREHPHNPGKSPCRIGLHKGDAFLYDSLAGQCRLFGFPPQSAQTPIDHWIEDNEVLEFGRHRLEILHTPGHTPGSCSFLLQGEGILFSGDTLFARSIGRTDLPGGDTAQILQSIRNRLFTLDDGTNVVPGHGEFTRIYEEKRHNPFFS